jgi:serine protease Do
MVGDTAVGKTVRVVVFRDGKTQTLKVVLTRREDAEKASIVPAATQPEVTQEKELLGLKLKGLDTDLRSQLGLGEGDNGIIVMGVDEASQAFEKGLRAGDLIVEAGQQKIASLTDLTKSIEQAREAGRKSILLLITRGGDRRFVALSLGS